MSSFQGAARFARARCPVQMDDQYQGPVRTGPGDLPVPRNHMDTEPYVAEKFRKEITGLIEDLKTAPLMSAERDFNSLTGGI
jgi:hypothetical protein